MMGSTELSVKQRAWCVFSVDGKPGTKCYYGTDICYKMGSKNMNKREKD